MLIIVLENVDYEVASKDKNLADLATQGASFTNFHALFHPSYPNYLAMVAGTDFDIHRRGRLLADNQVNFPDDAAHRIDRRSPDRRRPRLQAVRGGIAERDLPVELLVAARRQQSRQLRAETRAVPKLS